MLTVSEVAKFADVKSIDVLNFISRPYTRAKWVRKANGAISLEPAVIYLVSQFYRKNPHLLAEGNHQHGTTDAA